MTTSNAFEQAKKFYTDNKEVLLNVMLEEFTGSIDFQEEYNQVAVWFDGFVICFQDSDMNGDGKGKAHWDNEGANSGLDDLLDILKLDERFSLLVASDEYWENEYLRTLINDFCSKYAEINDIESMFSNEE